MTKTDSKKKLENLFRAFERMAATYSRGIYKTTTIGHAVFDGRVRNGNGSDHCGNATKIDARFRRANLKRTVLAESKLFFENYTQVTLGLTIRESKLLPLMEKQSSLTTN